MVRAWIAASVILVLGSCVEEPDPQPVLFGPDLVTQQRALCERSGGSWGAGGKPGTEVCYRQNADANKQCTAATDCDGVCFARSRTCSPIAPLFGCHDILTSLGSKAEVCLE